MLSSVDEVNQRFTSSYNSKAPKLILLRYWVKTKPTYFIPPIKNGAKEFLQDLSKNYDVKLFTTRNRLLASKWVIENGLSDLISDVTNIKEPCWVYIDDRCITFNGHFDGLLNQIDTFKPYYK